MKSTVLITILLAAARGFAVAAESEGKPEAPIGATATLCDGSIIKGTLQTLALPAESELLGDVTLDLLKVKSIDAASPLGEAPIQRRVTFRNGDHLTVRFPDDLKDIPFNTVFERIKLPLASVSKLAISGDTAGSLLYHCTFDNEQSITSPVAGPAGKFLAGEFVPGKVGNALRSPGDLPIAEVDLPRGTMQPRGTIEFWAKIEVPPAFFGDRGNPLFFGLWLFENPGDPGLCSTHLGWGANNGMGMAGLCGMVYHRAMATDSTMRTNTYGPLLSDPAAWHHYAIVWDSEGLPFAKASDGTPAVATLVLDGRVLQTFGRNQLSKGEGLLRLPSLQGKLAFPVPAARWSNPGNHVPFLIDEFKIWSTPKIEP